MPQISILDNVKFICEPKDITFKANYNYTGTITVSLNLNEVRAVSLELQTKEVPIREKDYFAIARRLCNLFMQLNEDDLYDLCDPYMVGLNIHKNLKKVMTRSGILVWSKN